MFCLVSGVSVMKSLIRVKAFRINLATGMKYLFDFYFYHHLYYCLVLLCMAFVVDVFF